MTAGVGDEKPEWLRVRVVSLRELERVRTLLKEGRVSTVCDSARCPNVGECWGSGTATFMILGTVCTRSCSFCAAKHGVPEAIDPSEPTRLASTAKALGLHHVVITSVTRDDLEDSGASHFAECVAQVKQLAPETKVELLISDLKGREQALATIEASGADVIGHNLEVVRSLQLKARDPQAGYERSINVLRHLSRHKSGYLVKSSLMLGLGETRDEVESTLIEVYSMGVDVIALGQYLKPKGASLDVVRYVHPREFEALKEFAEGLGFIKVFAGPLVRSSYHASEVFADSEEMKAC
ncbi:MAG TPA: lipoyl synthase [Methanomassiliicoccales archaeon]|nr:lipoyl synthase [Methanomassiliicoccales archaeon]